MVGRRTSAVWIRRRARFAAISCPPRQVRKGAVRKDDEGPDRALEQNAGGSPVTPGARLGGFGAAFLHRHHGDGAALAPEDQAGDQDDPAAAVPLPESHADVRAQFALKASPGSSLAERGEAKRARPFRHQPASGRRGDEALVRQPQRRVGIGLPSEPVGPVQEPMGQHPHRGRRAVPAARGTRAVARARFVLLHGLRDAAPAGSASAGGRTSMR